MGRLIWESLKNKVEKRVTEAMTSGTTILVTAALTFVFMVVVLKFVWA
jgi:hypothetical protein